MASESDEADTIEFEDPGVDSVETDQFDHLPSTDIETELHVHFGMAGSFPLRLVDMFFADDGLHIAEYSYITPLFGLGFKKHTREAGAMKQVYEVHGIDEVLLQADTVHWLNYGAIDRILLHRGGFMGRPKLTVYPADRSRSHAIRLHEDDDPDALAASLRETGETYGFDVDVESGTGFDPVENVERFFS
jgi:hypothetical protein